MIFRYRAMYNYKPQNEDEVELCEGKQLKEPVPCSIRT